MLTLKWICLNRMEIRSVHWKISQYSVITKLKKNLSRLLLNTRELICVLKYISMGLRELL